jgi:hypothetical protein
MSANGILFGTPMCCGAFGQCFIGHYDCPFEGACEKQSVGEKPNTRDRAPESLLRLGIAVIGGEFLLTGGNLPSISRQRLLELALGSEAAAFLHGGREYYC